MWVKTAAGKSAPLNATPDPLGNLGLDAQGLAVIAAKAPMGPRYTSHFATCPQAGQHRRKHVSDA